MSYHKGANRLIGRWLANTSESGEEEKVGSDEFTGLDPSLGHSRNFRSYILGCFHEYSSDCGP
jgi:hypothetical protein